MTASSKTEAARGLAELLIDASLDGLVVVDAQGRIVLFNSAAGQIFGLEPRQMIGESLERLLVPGIFVEHQRYIHDELQGKGHGVVGSLVEVEGWHSSGRPVPIEIALSEAKLDEERHFVACIRDLRRRREGQLARPEAGQPDHRASFSVVAAGLAHDFGNTVGVIMGYASALLAELPRGQRHYADVAQILALAHRARRLTESLLSLSGPRESISQVLDVNRLVRTVVGLLRRSIPRTITIKLRLSPGNHVQGDGARLEQCLMNLLLNARDAMPRGGELLVEARQRALTEGEATQLGLQKGLYCTVSVRDQGVGMDPATLARVRQPFFSTKPPGEGKGLGLSVVQSIVKAHGGAITIESQPGKGTEVQVCLPSAAPSPVPPAPKPLRPGPAARPGCSETILVIDDDRALRTMARRLLEALGYRALLAASGEEALGLVAAPGGVDLVLLDLSLAGLSGAALVERLRQTSPGLRVLVSSGLGRGEEPGLDVPGVCGFLPKPYGLDELSEALRSAFDEK